MKTNILLILSAIMLSGCNMVIKTMYGIKKPRIENKTSILKKADKLGLDTSNIVSVNGKDFLYVLKGKGIPDADIFDKNGRYIEYRLNDSSCNAGLFNFIPSLNVNTPYHQTDSNDLNTQLNKCRDLYGNHLPPIEQADFYVLIYWTTWTGRLNKDHVKVWEEQANNNKQCRIKVIKVNLDFQEYWEKGETDKVLKAVRKKK